MRIHRWSGLPLYIEFDNLEEFQQWIDEQERQEVNRHLHEMYNEIGGSD